MPIGEADEKKHVLTTSTVRAHVRRVERQERKSAVIRENMGRWLWWRDERVDRRKKLMLLLREEIDPPGRSAAGN
jgi:hypothetical protein